MQYDSSLFKAQNGKVFFGKMKSSISKNVHSFPNYKLLFLHQVLLKQTNCSLFIKRKRRKRSLNHSIGTRERGSQQSSSYSHNQGLSHLTALGQQLKNVNVLKYLQPYKHGLVQKLKACQGDTNATHRPLQETTLHIELSFSHIHKFIYICAHLIFPFKGKIQNT